MRLRKDTNRVKLVVDQELIIAIGNLITVAEEMYDKRRVIDSDDIIALHSVGTAKEFIQRFDREMKLSTFNKD